MPRKKSNAVLYRAALTAPDAEKKAEGEQVGLGMGIPAELYDRLRRLAATRSRGKHRVTIRELVIEGVELVLDKHTGKQAR